MPSNEIDRKIAVIFVADVVGYSKHMEKDEDETLKSYSACETILNNLLEKYKGKIFNTAGDSVLAEFSSAVNAVECGVAFQSEIKKKNESNPSDVKLEFRIGINMGDVVSKDGNLLGDGVNIAARLEALAQPAGITISKSVYDFVVPKTKMSFNDLGIQKVKLIGDAVSFPTAAFDIAPQISKIMQNPPQNVGVAGIVEATVKAVKELRRQGYKGRIIGSGISADPDLAGKLGKEGDGTLYASWFWKDRDARSKSFTAKFNAMNKKRGIIKANPHHVDASAYDIVYLLKQVMEKAGITGQASKLKAERTAIRDTLKTFKFSGVTGNVCFNKFGDAQLPTYVMEIVNSDVRMIDSHPSKKCS